MGKIGHEAQKPLLGKKTNFLCEANYQNGKKWGKWEYPPGGGGYVYNDIDEKKKKTLYTMSSFPCYDST